MRILRMAVSLLMVGALVVGCASPTTELDLPRISSLSQSVYLKDLADLDQQATAVAVVKPTGKSWIEMVEVVDGGLGTPFPIVELRIVETIKGKLPDVINLRQGYTYENAKGDRVPVVSGPGQFLLYLEPFSFGDGAPWNGQWVTTAWLSGVYMDLGVDSGVFTKVDPDRPMLPDTLTVAQAADPATAQVDAGSE